MAVTIDAATVIRVEVIRGTTTLKALIVPSIDERALVQHTELWQLLLTGEGDEGWDWRDLTRRLHKDCDHFSLWIDDVCEGLVIVNTSGKDCEMLSAGSTGLYGCYVEVLCKAPWNRSTVRKRAACERVQTGLVGQWLLWRAAVLSDQLGFQGRIAWHSLLGARDSYKRMGLELEDLGPDDTAQGEPRYELGSAAAKRFIASMADKVYGGYSQPIRGQHG
ncbi:MAG: hypothetical protein EXR07_21345 [Acetobacteraceae bacterium]|nr:hypothetical protein [Acetobacteraceae bacterium]